MECGVGAKGHFTAKTESWMERYSRELQGVCLLHVYVEAGIGNVQRENVKCFSRDGNKRKRVSGLGSCWTVSFLPCSIPEAHRSLTLEFLKTPCTFQTISSLAEARLL